MIMSKISTLLLCLIHGVVGKPMMIVTSGRPRCIQIEAPQRTALRVTYEAPDVVLDKEDKSHGPTYITITEKPAVRVLDTLRELDNRNGRRPKRKPLQPTTKEIEQRTGELIHKVQDDGQINICIRASTAGSKNPLLFSLHVETIETENNNENDIKTLGVDYHLSYMEKEMNRIESSMHYIISEADFAKERDSLFHKQTNAMHSASLFWPIVQVCVLLITGFTQATHIVRFFKSRRII